MTDNRAKNRALAEFLLLPTLFLTAALMGGLRVAADGAFVFVAPPLVSLVLAVLLMVLFVRGRLVEPGRWLSAEHAPLENVARALTLAALFFASAQTFNSVLPDAGLLRWMFSFFFLWTLWNNLFSVFDARRLLRSLAALFGTAFVLKHMLLAGLYAPDGGWLKRLAGALLEGATLGTLDADPFAPATGYISFFTLLVYVGGLLLVPAVMGDGEAAPARLTTPTRAAAQLAAVNEVPAAATERAVRVETRER
ncbi:MAG TPA: hypothetical protein VER08_08945 [Pyrinomonadaceae bacterium]|nr:hypothetical protein [Pyrinomonadaceae bacterium]